MKVVLTGATGFIGSHVLADLHKHGHEVIALVRDDLQAEAVAARGATPAVVDLYDRPATPTAPSTRPVPATPPARTSTRRWSTR